MGGEYIEAWHDIDRECEPLLGGQDEHCYVRKWVKRGVLRYATQRANHTLKIQKLSVAKYIACFPDEHKMLPRLLADPELNQWQNLKREVKEALQELKYSDDPELVSMHSCLFDDIDCQTALRSKPDPVEWLRRNWKTILGRLKEYYKEHGVWEHPGRLFMRCVDLR